MLTRDA